MCRLRELVHYHPYRVMLLLCLLQVGHKIHRDLLPLPLSYLQWLKQPCWLLVFSLNLLTCETSSNKIPHVSLHPALVILSMKILVHLHATWMHGKPRAMKLPENLLSQIGRMGNHYSSPISRLPSVWMVQPSSPVPDCTRSLMDTISASCH